MPKSKKSARRHHATDVATRGQEGSQVLAQRFTPQASKLDATEVRPFRIEMSLATTNAAAGVDAVLAHVDEIKASLPNVDLAAIAELSDLGSAVAYAAGQVDRFAAIPTDTKALLAQAQKLRLLLLTSADTLVMTGAFPAGAVAAIRKGRGAIDTAGDCVALAALFRQHASAIVG